MKVGKAVEILQQCDPEADLVLDHPQTSNWLGARSVTHSTWSLEVLSVEDKRVVLVSEADPATFGSAAKMRHYLETGEWEGWIDPRKAANATRKD